VPLAPAIFLHVQPSNNILRIPPLYAYRRARLRLRLGPGEANSHYQRGQGYGTACAVGAAFFSLAHHREPALLSALQLQRLKP
jgi:hypothetical protein